MAFAQAPTQQKREKPLFFFVATLVRKAHEVSLLLIIASIAGLLILPVLDRAIRFDEKGLLAGSSHPTVGISADADVAAVTRISRTAGGAAAFQRPGAAEALAAELRRVGLVDTQLTHPIVAAPGPAGGPPSPCRCTNLHTRVRAPRGDGLEALAVVTPVAFAPQRPDPAHDGRNQTAEGAELALRAGASLALHMARGHVAGGGGDAGAAGGGGRWLVRDLLWVVPDLSCGSHQCLAAWVRQYYEDALQGVPGSQAAASADGGGELEVGKEPLLRSGAGGWQRERRRAEGSEVTSKALKGSREPMVRGGVIQQAVVLEALAGASYDTPEVLVMGHDGLLPKLDMFYLLRYLFNYPTGTALWRSDRLEAPQRLLTTWLQGLLPAKDLRNYVRRLLTGLQFAWQQAVGLPAGAHAAFKDFMVDAASVRLVQRHGGGGGGTASDEEAVRYRSVALAYSLELTLRSLNNLVERVHHSSFLYLLTDLDRFVSVERYVAPAVALAAVLQLQAAWSMAATQGTPTASTATPAAAVARGGGTATARHIWATAAARAATRTVVLAAAAAGLRRLACDPARWLGEAERDTAGAGAGLTAAPTWAVSAASAARTLLSRRLSTPDGALVAAAALLAICAAAAAAARLAGRLVGAAAANFGAEQATEESLRSVKTSGASTGADAAVGHREEEATAGRGKVAERSRQTCGDSKAGGRGASAEQAAGGELGVPPDVMGCSAPEAAWHAERVVVLTATAAAMTALVCLNWAAAVVAGAYLAPMALWQGWAMVRIEAWGKYSEAGGGGGASGASGRVWRLSHRVLRVLHRMTWVASNPLVYLLLLEAATSAAGFGVSGSLFSGTAAGSVCGVSATNYWYGSVAVGSFWLFGLGGSFAS